MHNLHLFHVHVTGDQYESGRPTRSSSVLSQNQKVKQVLAFIPCALFKYLCIYAGLYQTFVGLNSVFLWSVTYFVDGPI